MKQIILLIILVQTQLVLSQNVYTYDTLTFNLKYDRSELLDFEDLKESNVNWNFRLWSNDYVLDLIETNNHLQGTVYMIARELHNETNPNACFIQIVQLDSNITIQLKSLITTFNNKNIPTQDSISNWGIGFDGSVYGIEFIQNGNYIHKTYWQPSSFPQIKEAVVVNDFVVSVENKFNFNKLDSTFYTKIPFHSFTINGFWLITKPQSKKEAKLYKRAIRKTNRRSYFNLKQK